MICEKYKDYKMTKYSFFKSIVKKISFAIFLFIHHSFMFANELSVISSYRDAGIIDQYEKEAIELTAIAKDLGYSIPEKHHLTFVSSSEMAQLASLGRYALPHWYDGVQIFSGMEKPSGVLEFVTQGDPVSKSFYSDTTSFEHQISVIMHVLGHNDFALNSGFAKSTDSYTTPASLELYELINQKYMEYDHDEVSQFVQWLFSLQFLQDIVGGSYHEPKSFELDSLKKQQMNHNLDKSQERASFGNVNSASILSATVKNLSPTTEPWKKEIISLFEKMVRHYPGNIQTKIINEGWATFSQFLIAKHSHWDNKEDAFIDFSSLLEAVTYPALSNPYWLGLECWKNVYRNFVQENSSISDVLTLDRMFVKKAHEIMAWQSSYDFIRSSLDEKWVKDKQLILYREATAEELKHTDLDEGLIILSRNAERIINAIARQNSEMGIVFPQIFIKSLNYQGSGSIALKHRVIDGIPLNLESSIQALYVYSLVTEKPIYLETVTYGYDEEKKPIPVNITVQLQPSGKVVLHQYPGSDLEKYLQDAVNTYELDLQSDEVDQLYNFRKAKYHKTIKDAVLNRMVKPACECPLHRQNKLISHSPTTSHAILEFEAKMTDRFSRMLTKAVTGDIDIKKSRRGVSFRVMPMVPSFELDQRVQSYLKSIEPPAPVDHRTSGVDHGYSFSQDDRTKIGRHKGVMPGDIIPKPEENQGDGEGEGEGEGEQEEGDSDESNEGGNGKTAPGEVEISLSDWGHALQEELRLPNIRITNMGKNRDSKLKSRGVKKRDHGEIVYRKTLPAAILYPICQEIIEDKDVNMDNAVDKIIAGLTCLQPSDYRVKSRKEVPKPQNRAVVVIVMDLSGSMQGKAHEMAANLVFNFKALLMSQYEDIEFRFIVYDTEAHEFTEDQVFGNKPQFLGGGTSNYAGYMKAEEVLNEYSYESWNKYVLGIGDAGNRDGPETVEILNRIYPDIQFFSYVFTNAGYWADPGFLESMQNFSKQNRWSSFVEMKNASQASVFQVLQDMFKES